MDNAPPQWSGRAPGPHRRRAAADRGLRATASVRRVSINGEPGILAWSSKGKPLGLMVCTVSGGRLTEVVSVLDPTRLAGMDLPDSEGT